MISRIVRKISREIKKGLGLKRAKKLGIEFSEPNYLYQNDLNDESVLIDVGCASDPDLSIFMIKKFNLTAFGVDPTRKHHPSLKEVEKKFEKFQHVNLAVANTNQTLSFYESKENDSGSIKEDHNNVVSDDVTSYEVEAVTVEGLLKKLGLSKVDYLKLDLEGIEYDLIESMQENPFGGVKQLFVEFHHHCIASRTIADTRRMVAKIEKFGFRSFTLDDANYLFYLQA